MDGPSAGITIATAIYSAIKGIPIDHRLAMTGELSIHGKVKPVGGIIAKVKAAKQAGATRVIIPAEICRRYLVRWKESRSFRSKDGKKYMGHVFADSEGTNY